MKVKDLKWDEPVTYCGGENTLHTAYDGSGNRFTVLDRLTGYGEGVRDIETGYMDAGGKFWFRPCGFDIREHPELTLEEAVNLVKQYQPLDGEPDER